MNLVLLKDAGLTALKTEVLYLCMSSNSPAFPTLPSSYASPMTWGIPLKGDSLVAFIPIHSPVLCWECQQECQGVVPFCCGHLIIAFQVAVGISFSIDYWRAVQGWQFSGSLGWWQIEVFLKVIKGKTRIWFDYCT